MILNMNGGGGVNLNFEVVSGATKPENPTENTIWVNTTTPINEVCFSANNPINPVSGIVWIKTGTSGSVSFNALKKNAIMICPLCVNQLINGNWEEKEAKFYQDNEWKELITYFYNGESSGWSSYKPNSNGGWLEGTLTFDNAMILNTDNDVSQIVVVSDNMHDLTNIETIAFVIDNDTVFSTNKDAYVGICNAKIWSWNPGDGNIKPPSQYAEEYVQITDTGEIDVDVTEFSGNHYLFICSINKQKIICSKVYSK